MEKLFKKLLSVLLCLVLAAGLVSILSTAGYAQDYFSEYNYFIEQEDPSLGTCTLCSALMMFRRAAIINGDPNWDKYKESTYMNNSKWWSSSGLYHYLSDGSLNAKYIKLAPRNIDDYGTSYIPDHVGRKTLFKDLLDEHPEGIVIWLAYGSNSDHWHAVLLNRYDSVTDTFYCADTYSSYANQELKLADCLLGTKNYVGMYTGKNSNTQDDILTYIWGYWCIYEGVKTINNVY